MRIAIPIYEGFDELDAIGPFEVFQNAADAGADCAVGLCTVGDSEPTRVTASHGLRVEPDGRLPTPEEPDAPALLVVPGGGWNDRSAAGAYAEYDAGVIPEAVAEHHAAGATVASVCTGGMLLAEAGVLDGRPAVTHRGALDDLRETDAVVREDRVVDDGDVVTAGGVTSGIDLALHLVEREFGASTASTVSDQMEYERR